MDYKRAARDAMKKTVGFAPALKNIIPMEGGDNGEIVTDVAFCIAATGKGYSWETVSYTHLTLPTSDLV